MLGGGPYSVRGLRTRYAWTSARAVLFVAMNRAKFALDIKLNILFSDWFGKCTNTEGEFGKFLGRFLGGVLLIYCQLRKKVLLVSETRK